VNKHLKNISAVFLLLLLITACNSQERTVTASAPQNFEGSTTHPCNNVFYPLARNNQWSYQLYIEGEPSSQTTLIVEETNETSAELTVVDNDSGTVTQSTVQCNEGEIINFPVTELNMAKGFLDGEVDIQHVDGVFFPTESALTDANWQLSWKTESLANGQLGTTIDGENFSAVLSSSPVNMEWQVLSTGGSLSVPAGNFENVVLIERRLEINVTELQAVFRGQNVNVSSTLSIITHMYYTPGIGLLKQELESAGLRFFGVNFPIEADASLVLTSYQIN
jgi:hypothetical protein